MENLLLRAVPFILIGLAVLGVLFLLLRDQAFQGKQKLKRENKELRALVERIREDAYTHRELDSPLATIILDDIRTHLPKELT